MVIPNVIQKLAFGAARKSLWNHIRYTRLYQTMCAWMCCFGLVMAAPTHSFSAEDRNRAPYVVMEPDNSGFFALFITVLACLDFYDQGALAGLRVNMNQGIYLDPIKGPNWWEYFFESIDLENPNPSLVLEDLSIINETRFLMSRERSYELIQKYVHLKPSIQKEVDAFVKKHFKKQFTIGIHHRGTDKQYEAKIVSYRKTCDDVDWHIENVLSEKEKKKLRIFVATDEEAFLRYARKKYGSKIICGDFVRANDGRPIHYTDELYSGNYQKGKEALMDCLLLSKCNLLFFPASSSLSMAASKFNPFIPAIALMGD